MVVEGVLLLLLAPQRRDARGELLCVPLALCVQAIEAVFLHAREQDLHLRRARQPRTRHLLRRDLRVPVELLLLIFLRHDHERAQRTNEFLLLLLLLLL